MSVEKFKEQINSGYTFKKDFITLGGGIYKNEAVTGAHVKIPLKTLNRHGLIAGATGTGKTKTLQVIAEQMSAKGIPTLLMDLKGDLSGLAAPGSLNDHIINRHNSIGDLPYEAQAFPVELLSLTGENGVKLRATVSEFGPVLLSKILGLNDNQAGLMSVVFMYCDKKKLPLIDLKDLKKVIQFLDNEGKEEIEKEYGALASSSVSAVMRKIITLEQQGADIFFGELSFDPQDLLRKDKEGRGYLNILRLTDIQDKPMLFSTFMLCLLAEIYSTFPEEGDLDQPKLCIFIDEAHLIFSEASKELVSQLESIIKLIRSKAVGVYFCTQNPGDIPDAVLGQLGLKVQHAFRAFTAKDRKDIKKTAENYPLSDYYDTAEELTQMGIGEAFITCLNEKGIPTPLARTLLRAPQTRMDVLSDLEIRGLLSYSDLVKKYQEDIDRESAYEILTQKLERANEEVHQEEMKAQNRKASTRKVEKEEPSFLEQASKNTMVRQVGRTIFRELARGLLGALGVKKGRR
jgi:uncharacterized protein